MPNVERKNVDMDINEILNCMSDCGCDAVQTEEFLALKENCCKESCIRYLKRHRKCLMEQIHQMSEKVDCVDYLIRELEKEAQKHG